MCKLAQHHPVVQLYTKVTFLSQVLILLHCPWNPLLFCCWRNEKNRAFSWSYKTSTLNRSNDIVTSRNRLNVATICTLVLVGNREPRSQAPKATRGAVYIYKEHVLLTSRRPQTALLATYRTVRVTFRYYRSLLDYCVAAEYTIVYTQ